MQQRLALRWPPFGMRRTLWKALVTMAINKVRRQEFGLRKSRGQSPRVQLHSKFAEPTVDDQFGTEHVA
jgi:hypothetical protein